MEPIQDLFPWIDPDWLIPVTSAAIVLIAIAVAIVFLKVILPIALRITNFTPTDLDSRLVSSVRKPVTFGILVLGGYLALTIPLDLTDFAQNRVDTVAQVLAVVLWIFLVVGMLSSAVDWYLQNLAGKTEQIIDVKLFPLLRRLSVVIIYGIGMLIVLDLLGIGISPLIAAMGLGGLAVALAIQPTLANLFAGTYVMTEGVIANGDYIQLEGGLKGYVVEVGWRSTRIRDWRNNIVVVPNAKFAETIITNYQQPTPNVNVFLECGTSYDSDLYRVEEVCNEVMDEVIDTHPMAVKEYGKYFAFDKFGDSNVNFWLFIQAIDRWGSFVVQSELIKLLHKRFKEEGIAINYPMRTLQFPEGWGPENLLSRNGHEMEGDETPRREPVGAAANGRNHGRRGRRSRTRKLTTSRRASDDDGGADGDGPNSG
ncbi:MAG: mechanosensitive ion channel family protein [Dehalococcoidia bacterium]